jgi:Subtilase family
LRAPGSSCRRALILLTLLLLPPAAAASGQELSAQGLEQIQALLAEKESRTPAQRKLDSNLLYAARQSRGVDVAPGVRSLATGIRVDVRNATVVDVTAFVSDALLQRLQKLGAEVLDVHRVAKSVRARVPVDALETIAGDPSVVFVQPKQQFVVWAGGPRPAAIAGLSAKLSPGFGGRSARARSGLSAAPAARPLATDAVDVSQGDVTHRANLARSTFGVTGAGIKVGVLSDGVDSLASLQASGDLPPVVTVLPGQAGSGDEGSAMLEIVHDLAPNAQLYFATGDNGIAGMAQNIQDLRAAGCDILIDDILYDPETPFQQGQGTGVVSTTNGGLILEAIDTVTAAGALYFTSAGNGGNKDDGTSGTWEGDFADGGPAGAPITGTGRLHDFDAGAGVAAYDAITAAGFGLTLHWSDPLGGSGNDYDLFVLDSAGASVVASSTNVQSGTQDPYEQILSASLASDDRIVIVKRTGALNRFLHLSTIEGKLALSTPGETHGHSAPSSANAFSVAATDAVGPYPSPFNSSNVVETFSSDGPRRYFFESNGTAITPGNFSSTGGQLFNKPDVTAADGVSCAAPTFDPFFGTSASAPHAGAIAALVKSAAPGLTAAQVSAYLTSTAIDIEAAGIDRDSGFGILDAYAAVQATGAPQATSFYTLTPCRVVDTRKADGPLAGPALSAGGTRTFTLTGQCGIPLTAKAVSINVTVTQPSAAGDLRLFAGGSPPPPASTINYRVGQTRANNATPALGASGGLSVKCDQASGTVHLIIDVNGYFQ